MTWFLTHHPTLLDRLSAQELGRHPLPAAALDHCSGGHRYGLRALQGSRGSGTLGNELKEPYSHLHPRALLSASVTTITSLSISAISTNCQVKAGESVAVPSSLRVLVLSGVAKTTDPLLPSPLLSGGRYFLLPGC